MKDEADVIEACLGHLAAQVDEIHVADNMSTDGTWEILHDLAARLPVNLELVRDDDVAYYQSRKMTRLALSHLGRHSWVVPVDADEAWHVNETHRRLGDFLDGLAPDVMIVEAALYHHLPTGEDQAVGAEPNPFRRIGWRKRECAALPKVACRLRPDLVIEAGNHGAATSGTALRSGGLSVRHFSWRTPDQYVRKIRNGAEAYRATNLPALTGAHWRTWDDATDDQLASHFREWFWSPAPREDGTLIYDPAPLRG